VEGQIFWLTLFYSSADAARHYLRSIQSKCKDRARILNFLYIVMMVSQREKLPQQANSVQAMLIFTPQFLSSHLNPSLDVGIFDQDHPRVH